MLIHRPKIEVPGAGQRTLHVKSQIRTAENTRIGSIRGESVKVVKASGQGHFNESGKFPPNGNQQKPKNRISFDIKASGDAANVATGPQDAKTQLAENQKKKSAARTLYPKLRSVEQTEARG